MSLTSYRTAPPRETIVRGCRAAASASREYMQRRFSRVLIALGGPGGDRLSHVLRRSTIGAEGFDGRVRNGIGFEPFAWATKPAKHNDTGRKIWNVRKICGHRLMRAIKPNEQLVPVSFACRHASTPGLSTWWSSTALQGELVLRWASRLDAFSGYPVRT